MRRTAREIAVAAALLGAAAGFARGETVAEAARRAGIVAQTAAVENDVAIVIGSDSTTGQGAVAVFRRGADGAWSLEKRDALCGGSGAAAAPPAAAPPAESVPPPPARPAAAPPSQPPAVQVPLAFPPPHGVSDGLARQVQDELRRRARQSADGGEKAARNGEYLKALAGDLGWIDIRRFGVKAACDAARIAVASGDRALLSAAMPWIEKDLRNSEEGQACYEAAEKASREEARP